MAIAGIKKYNCEKYYQSFVEGFFKYFNSKELGYLSDFIIHMESIENLGKLFLVMQ